MALDKETLKKYANEYADMLRLDLGDISREDLVRAFMFGADIAELLLSKGPDEQSGDE